LFLLHPDYADATVGIIITFTGSEPHTQIWWGMVIGFVGGSGIGYYLSQQINSLIGYHKAGTAIWAIVIVVWAMDFLSSEVRKRIT
jgi:hypothetical protein